MHEPIHLHITHAQIGKIRRGQPIQIPHAHIGHPQGHVFRHLHPETHKKLVKAYHARKGARVHLTESELEGTGLFDVIKKGVQFVAKHADVLKPLATTVLDTGAHFIPGAAPYRETIRKYTGVGIKRRIAKRKVTPRRISGSHKKMSGGSLVPAGYAGF